MLGFSVRSRLAALPITNPGYPIAMARANGLVNPRLATPQGST